MSQKLRIIIPLALLGAAGVAYAAHVSAGTLSAFGWESISLICPIGALGTMLASKMLGLALCILEDAIGVDLCGLDHALTVTNDDASLA